MNWLARLKKLESSQAPTLQNLQKEGTAAFVGFVGSCPEPFQNSGGEVVTLAGSYSCPANDEKDGGRHAEGAQLPSPEQLAPPGQAVDVFTARLALFTDRGLSMGDAKAIAERLAKRDLEQDERRLCMECMHLSGGTNSRRCSQWQKIGLIRGAAIPGELVMLLQRCAGFNKRLEVMI